MARGLDDDLNRFYGPVKEFRPDDLREQPAMKAKTYVQCFESHPALIIPGTDLKIYGGSCSHPVVKDADIYIGFDYGMKFTPRSWPWKQGEEFLFEIQDMCAPGNAKEFVKLVEWTASQLLTNKKVHCGCIGGHGRTGTFLAALTCTMAREKDAIEYVRTHYCERAIESSAQVSFLSDVFGILPAQGSKTGHSIKLVNGKNKTPSKIKYEHELPPPPVYERAATHISYLKDFSIWD